MRSALACPLQSADLVLQAIYATDLIFLLSTWTGKLSVSFLFTRLAQESNKTRLGWALSALILVFGVISFISVAIRPDTKHPWLYHEGDVTSILARWIATGVMSIFTDIIVTGMSIYLVWDLNMASKSKSLVITAFTLRLFVTPVTIARLVTLSNIQHDDLSFSYSLPEVMTQLEMYCNLITTTLPCLRLFLTAWNTSFMDMRLEEIDHDAYRERKLPLNSLAIRPIPIPNTNVSSRCNYSFWFRNQGLDELSFPLQTWHTQSQRYSCFSLCSCRLGAYKLGQVKSLCRKRRWEEGL